jgi:broad specificity phosphatase PhoE
VIHLVRHGRTSINAGGRLQGRIDPPLDEVGRAQAAAIGRVPALLAAPRVIASPLQRAQETAASLGKPVEVDERWVELDYGEWDGLPLAEVPRQDWARWRDDPSWGPPGGESLVDVGRRVGAAMAELVAEVGDEDVVVVSHVSPIKAAVAWVLEVGDQVSFRLHLDPASVTRIGVVGGRAKVRGFNDTSHLAP